MNKFEAIEKIKELKEEIKKIKFEPIKKTRKLREEIKKIKAECQLTPFDMQRDYFIQYHRNYYANHRADLAKRRKEKYQAEKPQMRIRIRRYYFKTKIHHLIKRLVQLEIFKLKMSSSYPSS